MALRADLREELQGQCVQWGEEGLLLKTAGGGEGSVRGGGGARQPSGTGPPTP